MSYDALSRLVQQFESSEYASQDSRAESERARDYRDGKQLTAEERKILRKRKQPAVVENIIGRKIDYLLGLERTNRTDPRAYPRTMQDEQAAEAATDALRYVDRDQNVDMTRSLVFDNILVEGYGGLEVTAQQTRGGVDPKIKHIAWHRLFYDPHSCALDFSDSRYHGYITWMDEAEALASWPDKAEVIKATMAKPTSTLSDTYDDKPKWAYWADKSRNRIRIVTQYWIQGGKWCGAVYTLGGFLEEPAQSPWIDENGEPECPLLLQSAYVDRDNDRYGVVRSMFDMQDETNKRRSKALHLISMRQVRISRSLETSAATIRAELAKPDGVIAADADELEILRTDDMSAGNFSLLQDARASLERMGPNVAMQGKGGQDQSGRAILALQQGGMVEMAPILDALRHLNLRTYRQIWNRIRQFWTGERWIRVTDDTRNIRFVGINVTEGQLAAQKIKQAVEAGEIDPMQAQQFIMQIGSDPAMQRVANNIGELDIDIDIDEQPQTPSLHAEQFETLAKMAGSGIPIPPEMLIEASSFRNKERLLKILEEQKAKPNPMAELQQRGATASIAKIESEVALNEARAAGERADAEIGAVTVQMKALQAGADSVAVAA